MNKDEFERLLPGAPRESLTLHFRGWMWLHWTVPLLCGLMLFLVLGVEEKRSWVDWFLAVDYSLLPVWLLLDSLPGMNRLRLDSAGVTQVIGGRRRQYRWEDTSRFRSQGPAWLAFHRDRRDPITSRRIAAISARRYGLDAADLAALLNAWRDAALARSGRRASA